MIKMGAYDAWIPKFTLKVCKAATLWSLTWYLLALHSYSLKFYTPTFHVNVLSSILSTKIRRLATEFRPNLVSFKPCTNFA